MTRKQDDAEQPGADERFVPLLALRDLVVLPHTVVPLYVGREKSIASLEAAEAADKHVLLVTQRDQHLKNPEPYDLYAVGTLATIIQMIRLPDGSVKVLVEGKTRVEVVHFDEVEPFFRVKVRHSEAGGEVPVAQLDEESAQLLSQLRQLFDDYTERNHLVPREAAVAVRESQELGHITDTIVANLRLKVAKKQAYLEIFDPIERLGWTKEALEEALKRVERERMLNRLDGSRRRARSEAGLNEHLQAMQRGLGERDEFKQELEELEARIQAKKVSEEAQQRLLKEIKKLKSMAPISPEAAVIRGYIDWVLSLPWFDLTEERRDLAAAEQILEAEHYGLKKPKERILEFLAVHALTKNLRGPILCLVGPPGVGKTSLARSIAHCTERNFVRIALGGVRDEAEIRGHRRTYVGAMPGKIVQALKKAGSNNPVILLDEIDKMSADFRGDPASALLEVLDPEQNNAFNDHYLDLDYDLSQVMFITTANHRHQIPLPLQDRLEIIELSGYTEFEKLNIAREHLVPRQKQRNGVDVAQIDFTEAALQLLISRYTRESGVRSLERQIASVCRKVARELLSAQGAGTAPEDFELRVTTRKVQRYLGNPRFKYGQGDRKPEVGLVNGLAYTSWGGDLLSVECAAVPGKGQLIITGRLGDVMQESARAAMSYVRSRAGALGLDPLFYKELDIHIHFPEGATPKDGPSAGITMATVLVSTLCQIKVRHDVAMTGEITLRGRVLPIGGLKEKVLAARRGGIQTIILPEENRKDIKEIPQAVRKNLEFILVQHADEVLAHALLPEGPLWRGPIQEGGRAVEAARAAQGAQDEDED